MKTINVINAVMNAETLHVLGITGLAANAAVSGLNATINAYNAVSDYAASTYKYYLTDTYTAIANSNAVNAIYSVGEVASSLGMTIYYIYKACIDVVNCAVSAVYYAGSAVYYAGTTLADYADYTVMMLENTELTSELESSHNLNDLYPKYFENSI